MNCARYAFEAIGTYWLIDIFEPINSDLELAIRQHIENFDRAYSRFRADSLVTKIHRQPGRYTFPTDASPMLKLYQDLFKLTDGAVTPIIGSTMEQAGYDAAYSLQPRQLLSPPHFLDAVTIQDSTVITHASVLFDFGAVGKGYLVDLVSEVIELAGGAHYLVDAGGDMRVRTDRPTRIGLEHPHHNQQVIGVVELANQSLCASSTNRRRWKHFHHILDPHTLQPNNSVLATWVVAESTLVADGLATALFFTPVEKLRPHYTFEAVVVYPDLSVQVTDGFPGEIFTKETI